MKIQIINNYDDIIGKIKINYFNWCKNNMILSFISK